MLHSWSRSPALHRTTLLTLGAVVAPLMTRGWGADRPPGSSFYPNLTRGSTYA